MKKEVVFIAALWLAGCASEGRTPSREQAI